MKRYRKLKIAAPTKETRCGSKHSKSGACGYAAQTEPGLRGDRGHYWGKSMT
jgi:hypothetical protein